PMGMTPDAAAGRAGSLAATAGPVVPAPSPPNAAAAATATAAGHAAVPGNAAAAGAVGNAAAAGSERGTRRRIARLILENGPVTAAGLSAGLGLTPAAVRRHLDNLQADGLIETPPTRSRAGHRGRGRPARLFAITDAGRSAFEHAYDDLAASALRFLVERAGPDAIGEFARRQVADLEGRYAGAVESASPDQRVQALA